MPCGFNGDSVDFDSVVAESEFCAGEWALPSHLGSTPCSATATVLGNLDNLSGNFNFAPTNDDHHHHASTTVTTANSLSGAPVNNTGFQQPPNSSQSTNTMTNNRKCNIELDDSESSLVTDELKNRLLVKYEDECTKMDTDEFDLKQDKDDRKTEDGGSILGSEEDDYIFIPRPKRISMLWNSKLRWKEERKKVLKISINKLRRIEDPELFLCRSVLINNTVRRLHREIREEKMTRYPEIHRPVPLSSCSLNHCNNSTIPESFPRKSSSFVDHKDNVKSHTVLSCGNNETSCRLDSCSITLDKMSTTNSQSDSEVAVPVAKRLKTVDDITTTTTSGMCFDSNNNSSNGNSTTTTACATTIPACSTTTATTTTASAVSLMTSCRDGTNAGQDGGPSALSSLPMGVEQSDDNALTGDSYAGNGGVHCKLSVPYVRHQQSASSLVGSSCSLSNNQTCMGHLPNVTTNTYTYNNHHHVHLHHPSSAAHSQNQSPCLQSPSLLGGGLSSQRANGCCGLSSSPFSTTDRNKAKCDQSFRSMMTDGRSVMSPSPEHLALSSTCSGNLSGMQLANKERRSVVSEYEKQYSQYSCGQLSIFGELQSVVFHSLIASLES